MGNFTVSFMENVTHAQTVCTTLVTRPLPPQLKFLQDKHKEGGSGQLPIQF